MAIATEELIQAGLCDGSAEHHLTAKGRNWLHALEEMEMQDAGREEAAADLVLSTNGLYR